MLQTQTIRATLTSTMPVVASPRQIAEMEIEQRARLDCRRLDITPESVTVRLHTPSLGRYDAYTDTATITVDGMVLQIGYRNCRCSCEMRGKYLPVFSLRLPCVVCGNLSRTTMPTDNPAEFAAILSDPETSAQAHSRCVCDDCLRDFDRLRHAHYRRSDETERFIRLCEVLDPDGNVRAYGARAKSAQGGRQ